MIKLTNEYDSEDLINAIVEEYDVNELLASMYNVLYSTAGKGMPESEKKREKFLRYIDKMSALTV